MDPHEDDAGSFVPTSPPPPRHQSTHLKEKYRKTRPHLIIVFAWFSAGTLCFCFIFCTGTALNALL